MAAVHRDFEYVPKSTRVDSPIDEALAARRGVCQDFAHIMIAAGRRLGLPCRYVSGYIAPRPADDRARARRRCHARVGRGDAARPGMDGVRSRPTTSRPTLRHIRVAIGRDYADVPPTRGVYKGGAKSTLAVSVDVTPSDAPSALEPMLPEPQWATEEVAAPIDVNPSATCSQQQQQQ